MTSAPAPVPAAADPVPASLRTMFVIHFWADICVAVPLFLAPEALLGWLGWPAVDPLAARLVACALFGIGIESLLGRNADAGAFRAMLTLKVIWSATAAAGIAWTILAAPAAAPYPAVAWGFFAIFAGFHGIWLRYLLLMRAAAGPAR